MADESGMSKQPVILFVLFVSGLAFSCMPSAQAPSKPWEEMFFREIDRAAEFAGAPHLRNTRLPANQKEIRIWRGFGTSPLEGLILDFDGSRWSAISILARNDQYPRSGAIRLPDPQAGWDSFCAEIDEHRLISLPDSTEIDCTSDQLDGVGYVVEIRSAASYRTYMYGNGGCPEAAEMARMSEKIVKEFGSKPPETWRWFISSNEAPR
jgi:hypothetical protein